MAKNLCRASHRAGTRQRQIISSQPHRRPMNSTPALFHRQPSPTPRLSYLSTALSPLPAAAAASLPSQIRPPVHTRPRPTGGPSSRPREAAVRAPGRGRSREAEASPFPSSTVDGDGGSLPPLHCRSARPLPPRFRHGPTSLPLPHWWIATTANGDGARPPFLSLTSGNATRRQRPAGSSLTDSAWEDGSDSCEVGSGAWWPALSPDVGGWRLVWW
jgi:hypothetical protein